MQTSVIEQHRLSPLSLFPKLFTWGTWALCGLVFYHVGWMFLAPDDPAGTVSIWSRSNALSMIIQAMGLMAVVAALATALVGRLLPDAGLFGACFGVSVVALRGGTVSSLLTSASSRSVDSSTWGLWFAVEAAVWGGVVILASAVAFLTYQWCCRSGADGLTASDRHSTTRASMMAGADLLALRSPSPSSASPHITDRLKHFAATVAIGLIGVSILSMDVHARAIHHGQACFAVALAFYIAGWMAHERFPLATPLFTLLAVPTAGILGYLWAWLQGDTNVLRNLASHVPTSVFLRTSPLIYVAVGSAAVLAGYWAARRAQPGR